MDSFLDQCSKFFLSYGVHPIIGGLIIGFILSKLVSSTKSSSSVSFDATSGLKKSEVLSSTIDTNRSFISSSMTSRGSVSVNGKTIELDGETLNNIIKLARDSKTIEAIKELRSVTGLDLKEAKEMVEIIAHSAH